MHAFFTMNKTEDEKFMQRALQLAKIGGVRTAPNPMVGAVIVHNNIIIGEGYHEKFGEAHAEVNAVNSVKNKELLALSTIYVTLEPCAHFGKTPPCAELLIKSEFNRVVVACKDPFSEVAGKGFELLRNAGIDLEIGVCETEALHLNRRFFTFHQKKRPFVILKWAQTSDGFIDIERNEMSEVQVNWISLPETKIHTHTLRSQESAILVGCKTVNSDNPSLTTRAVQGSHPLRIVLDPNNKINPSSKVISDEFPSVIFSKDRNELIENKEWISINDYSVSLILTKLYNLKILSVIIEGGAFTIQQFIDANLWDEAQVITGNTTFKSGKKAPILKKYNSIKELKSGTDKINFYACLS